MHSHHVIPTKEKANLLTRVSVKCQICVLKFFAYCLVYFMFLCIPLGAFKVTRSFYAHMEDVRYLPKDLFGDKNPVKMNMKKELLKRQEKVKIHWFKTIH